jgi:hypothetical protein
MIRPWVAAVLAMAAWVSPALGQAIEHKEDTPLPPSCSADAPAQPTAPSTIYVDQSLDQLRKSLPALHGIRFADGFAVNDGAQSGSADHETASILTQSGAVIAAMLHHMPNLVAKEEVTEVIDPPQQQTVAGSPGRTRGSMPYGGQQYPGQQYGKTTVYSYRIVSKRDSVLGDAIDEFRMDAHNRPIEDVLKTPDGPRSVGFGTTWLFFLPRNLGESRFRYLGRQKLGKRDTYVLAFAQIPERIHYQTVIAIADETCSTVLQGIAWIDQATFKLVRIETDLLTPLPKINLDQLRSTVNYSEVKIPLHDPLSLPTEVEIAWRSGGQGGGERHDYSNYKLYGVTSTVLRTDGKPLE